jgi:hypothetical protein
LFAEAGIIIEEDSLSIKLTLTQQNIEKAAKFLYSAECFLTLPIFNTPPSKESLMSKINLKIKRISSESPSHNSSFSQSDICLSDLPFSAPD